MARAAARWLVFFYSVPARPVKNRMAVWRRLMRAGAVQLKGSVYVLPRSPEHEEFLRWLVEEVSGMGGDGAFMGTDTVEPIGHDGIVALFNDARAKDYQPLERDLSSLERKIEAVLKGGKPQGMSALTTQSAKLESTIQDTLRIDFFGSTQGRLLLDRHQRLKRRLSLLSPDTNDGLSLDIPRRSAHDYQGKTWTTRQMPFVDRMASAWLIRKFIDPGAEFGFTPLKEAPGDGALHFDISGGEFTHVGNLCTMEVLAQAFGLKDKAMIEIARIVHELDIKDGKFPSPEAKGVEEILTGIRNSARDDMDALKRGMDIFEMLYISRRN